jgi:hypothetical protein
MMIALFWLHLRGSPRLVVALERDQGMTGGKARQGPRLLLAFVL